jgi:hypothetical protein
VGEVRQRSPVRRAARCHRLRRHEDRGDERGGDEVAAHDQGGGGEQLAGVGDAVLEVSPVVVPLRLDQRHHRHAGLEPGESEHQQRERQHRRERDLVEAADGEERVDPAPDVDRLTDRVHGADPLQRSGQDDPRDVVLNRLRSARSRQPRTA